MVRVELRSTSATVYLATVAVAGGLVLVLGLVLLSPTELDLPIFLALALGHALTVLSPLRTRHRGDTIAVTVDEVFLIPAFVLLPTLAPVVVVAIGETLGRVAGRLWSPPSVRPSFFGLRRSIFNVSQSIAAAGIAVGVYTLLVSPTSSTVAAIAAGVVAAAVYGATSWLLVTGMIALVTENSFVSALKGSVADVVVFSAAVWVGGALLALVTLTQPIEVAWIGATAVLLLVVSVLASRIAQQREQLAGLLDAAVRIHGSVDRDEVAEAITESATKLLYCEEARIGGDGVGPGEIHAELAPGTWLIASRPRASYSSFDAHDESVLDAIAAIARPALEHAERVEALRGSDDMKAAVLASVAHDFRTPLSTGMGVLELLGDGGEAEEDRPYLFHLLRSSLTRIERIVESLLDLQRYELGRLPEPANANVAAVVADVASNIGDEAEVTVTGDASLRARIDVPALERVVENLVANSVKHAPGSPVRVSYERDDRGLISIVVEDDGPGVQSDGDVFAPFNQGDRTSGTGLGLWIARTFIEGRGGRIWVEEAVGGGAAFHVELPPAP